MKPAQFEAQEPVAWMSEDEREAFERFNETCEDGEGYDVPKTMMRRLAEIGVIHHTSRGIYGITKFGRLLVGNTIPSQRTWVGLSDEEILEVWKENEKVYPMDRSRLLDRTRACIRKAQIEVGCAECGVNGGHALYCVECAEKFVGEAATKLQQKQETIEGLNRDYDLLFAEYQLLLKKEWVGLTDDEIYKIAFTLEGEHWKKISDAIEAKLKQKNGYAKEKNA